MFPKNVRLKHNDSHEQPEDGTLLDSHDDLQLGLSTGITSVCMILKSQFLIIRKRSFVQTSMCRHI